MKKIKFVFKNNDDIIYDIESTYEKKDGLISLTIDDVLVELNLSNGFLFHRVTDEYKFLLKANSSEKKCQFYLVQTDSTFDIEIRSFEHIKDDKKHIVKYCIESDPENTKTIILSFIE